MPRSFRLGTVEVHLTPQQRFGQFLELHGKRFTRQRQQIVEQVFSHHDHFDADELLEHLRPLVSARQVSRPTVYRTLVELVEAGLLRRMTLDGRSIYEHDYGYPNHDHLYCQVCNSLVEFHSEELERIRDHVAEEYRFEVSSHRMFITGVCQRCQQSRGRRRKDEG